MGFLKRRRDCDVMTGMGNGGMGGDASILDFLEN